MEQDQETQKTLLPLKTQKSITIENEEDELKNFRIFIKWACIDQSNKWKTSLSCLVFIILCFCVPIISHFVIDCSTCNDEDHKQPFDSIVELSLSSISILSFLSLTHYLRKYGLTKFLFFDKLSYESHSVRLAYTLQLQVCIYHCFLNLFLSFLLLVMW